MKISTLLVNNWTSFFSFLNSGGCQIMGEIIFISFFYILMPQCGIFGIETVKISHDIEQWPNSTCSKCVGSVAHVCCTTIVQGLISALIEARSWCNGVKLAQRK